MTKRPYRKHSPDFKISVCTAIRNGAVGRKEALRLHGLSGNLVQLWLTQFDRGELAADQEEAAADLLAEYEEKIAMLERKVGQLTMELEKLNGAASPESPTRTHAPTHPT